MRNSSGNWASWRRISKTPLAFLSLSTLYSSTSFLSFTRDILTKINRDDLTNSNAHKDGQIRELTEENTNLKIEVKGLKDDKNNLENKGKNDLNDIESLRRKV